MKQLLLVASLLALGSAKKSILETGFEALGSINGADIHINFLDQQQGLNPIANVVAKAVDKNEDGKVTMEEFEKITEDALDAFFKMHDLESDGSVSEEEILSGGYTIEGIVGIINIVFRVADVNRDGFISSADYMKQGPTQQLSLVSLLDSNKDGRISLQEYQEFGDGQLPELPEPLVKAIKLLDRDLDGQVSLEDVDNFVKACWSIFDQDQSGHVTVDEQISALKQHGMSEVFAAKIKKQFTQSQNAIMKITRDIVNEIDDDVDGQVDRNEFIAVLKKPFPDPEMLAKLVESVPDPRPSMDGSGGGLPVASEMEAAQIIKVLDSFLDNPKFSEFKSSSSKSCGKYWVISITVLIAFML